VGSVLAAAVVLVVLTLIASEADPNGVDLTATRALQRIDNPIFATFMYVVSWFGFAQQSRILPLVLAGMFAARHLWVEALWILGSQAASMVTIALKDVVHRARPSPDLVGVLAPLSDPSFPSGHVVQYTALFGTAFFLVYVLAQPSARRTAALATLATPIVLVGPSRLYLGQHWLSDVLGGYAVAALLLVPYCWAYAKWRLEARRTGGAINREPGPAAQGTAHRPARTATRSPNR
jgi:undecaprenyl-diphosphatase